MAGRSRSWQSLVEGALDLRQRARAAVAAGVAELVEPSPRAAELPPGNRANPEDHASAAPASPPEPPASAEVLVRRAYDQLRRAQPLSPPARLIGQLRLIVNQLENSGTTARPAPNGQPD